MKPSRLHLLLLSLALTLGSACSFDIAQDNELTDPRAVHNIQSAYEMLASAYDALPEEQLQLSLLASDLEPLPIAGNDRELRNLYLWRTAEISNLAQTLWEGYYKAILAINLLDERQSMIAEQNEPLHYLLGEIRTLKAYAYLQLLGLFSPAYRQGDAAPGIILKSASYAQSLDRASQQQSLEAILSLLDEADAHFEAAGHYLPAHGGAYHVSAATARALRARAMLYVGDYVRALAVCDGLHLPHTAPLETTRPSAWVSSPGDALFVQSKRTRIYTELYHDNAAWRANKYIVPAGLALAEGDGRLGVYALPNAGRITFAPPGTQLMGKYNLSNMERQDPLLSYRMRWSEIVYIRAEALHRIGREEEARQALAERWALLGLDPAGLSALHGDALLEAIITDKRKEFLGEGLNFFDAKRLQRAQLRAGGEIRGNDYRYTFPIPRSEYAANSMLSQQNPGWPTIKIQ